MGQRVPADLEITSERAYISGVQSVSRWQFDIIRGDVEGPAEAMVFEESGQLVIHDMAVIPARRNVDLARPAVFFRAGIFAIRNLHHGEHPRTPAHYATHRQPTPAVAAGSVSTAASARRTVSGSYTSEKKEAVIWMPPSGVRPMTVVMSLAECSGSVAVHT